MRFLALVDAHPNVYADVGNSRYAFDDDYRVEFDRLLRSLLGPRTSTEVLHLKRRRRLMFGSDYWMNTLNAGHAGALDGFRDGVQRLYDAEVADGFLGGNALRWLGLTGEDNEPDATSKARARLVDFYGDHALPDWLVLSP
jgi:predicted TIM-barrel fold metal-dependent hydrolase